MELVGQTRGSQDVEIRARVEGYLDRVAFSEGSFVRKGDAALPDRPEAPRGGARPGAGRPRHRAGAVSRRPRTTWRATRRWSRKQAVSQQELDNARRRRRTRRRRRSTPARRPSTRRALDLGYTAHHLADRRPRRHHAGEGRQPGRPRREHAAHHGLADRPDPLPRRHQRGRLPAHRPRAPRRSSSSAAASRARSSSSSPTARSTPTPGKLDAVERAVDPTTGTLAHAVRVPQPRAAAAPRAVRPRARFVLDIKTGALLVPQRAVQELQNLYNVAVVDADDKVAIRTVKVGPRVESALGDRGGPEAGRAGGRRGPAARPRRA